MNEVYIEEDKSILDAMQQLDKGGKKILFVHKEGKLLASLTDGDIRRWILKKGDLQISVKYAANYRPKYLYEQQAEQAMYIIKEQKIDAIPIVDRKHMIKRVVFAGDLVQDHKVFDKEIPVVIMAGGLGTRLSPYTNILPKPLIPVGDYPIVEHIINRFCTYGCKQFYMIVNYKRNMIKAYFDELEKKYRLDFITEEKALGTGGGISLLKGRIKDTFILTNCDILLDDDLTKAYEQHIESENMITMVCSLKNFTIPYGVVNIGENGLIESMQEKPSMSFFTNTGCYFVEPEVIEELEYNEPIDFPAIIEKYMSEKKRIGVYPIGEEAWLDMGQLDELEKMKERLGC
ncbi:MAG: nucleotidyltransferase family protein [Roseburia sp.]|nr:nucleotidyltransferase family protein [Roseburia sp.]MCM1201663.1 nucleotidyltransferase family protein [Bacteroides fragilis]